MNLNFTTDLRNQFTARNYNLHFAQKNDELIHILNCEIFMQKRLSSNNILTIPKYFAVFAVMMLTNESENKYFNVCLLQFTFKYFKRAFTSTVSRDF
ncbi:CLUMA_CG004660, isoform A [Clunio marinus]|uniref:CLUMA_CG004660, isoform A n=1 Tax=Clunio marinus TaxID=568069 RepID=A0A1J1HSK9_9DIPT|nr:CLUMA_CG004660, isoform A [Clunio marinus]